MEEDTHILTINGGSSSIKFALFRTSDSTRVLDGKIDHIGMDSTYIETYVYASKKRTREAVDSAQVFTTLTETLEALIPRDSLVGIGHRVVHGGHVYSSTTHIDEAVLANLKKIASFAPRHLPNEILLLEQFLTHYPRIPQFACFDTSFFHELPLLARLLPIPRTYQSQGIRRYGFHGLSYEYVMHYLTTTLGVDVSNKKIILAHLGSGASLTAVQNGRPVDTSMSFTPNSGIPMGTRSGDTDPGFIAYLSREEHMSTEDIEHLLNFESGIKGISGSTADMEVLLQMEDNDTQATDAIDYFVYHVQKQIGALSATMNGVDIIVFTGGMGEKSAPIRQKICAGLSYLGIKLNTIRNVANSTDIGDKESRVILYVIKTDEEAMVVEHVHESLRG